MRMPASHDQHSPALVKLCKPQRVKRGQSSGRASPGSQLIQKGISAPDFFIRPFLLLPGDPVGRGHPLGLCSAVIHRPVTSALEALPGPGKHPPALFYEPFIVPLCLRSHQAPAEATECILSRSRHLYAINKHSSSDPVDPKGPKLNQEPNSHLKLARSRAWNSLRLALVHTTRYLLSAAK